MESLFLENRCHDSGRWSFRSQRDITGRPMAKHCFFLFQMQACLSSI